MRKINWRRVLLGGSLAGVVANVLLSAAWWLFLERLGPGRARRPMQPTGGASVGDLGYFMIPFLAGILAVGLYAVMRPRYGPGLKAAVCAGLVCWLVTGAVPLLIFGAVGRFSVRLWTDFGIGLATYLVAIIVATIAGASVYKEQDWRPRA